MAGKNNERDNDKLIRLVYDDLVEIAEVIHKNPDNSKLIDAFDSLLSTYLDAEGEV